MENRRNSRRSVDLSVVIRSSFGLIIGKARNVSFSGVYVETAPAVTLSKNSVVEVAFPIYDHMEPVPARVARATVGGLGLSFPEAGTSARAIGALIDRPESGLGTSL